MPYLEEMEIVKEIEKSASNQFNNEMEHYFKTYEYYKKIMDDAGFENTTITITRKK